jgi:hypothetical protein
MYGALAAGGESNKVKTRMPAGGFGTGAAEKATKQPQAAEQGGGNDDEQDREYQVPFIQ